MTVERPAEPACAVTANDAMSSVEHVADDAVRRGSALPSTRPQFGAVPSWTSRARHPSDLDVSPRRAV